MSTAFSSHEGDSTASLTQMARALRATPFHFVTSSEISRHLELYMAPHDQISVFSTQPQQAADPSVMGLMNMTASFRHVFQADLHLSFLGWANFTPAEKIATYSDWWCRKLQKILFLWLTDRLVFRL